MNIIFKPPDVYALGDYERGFESNVLDEVQCTGDEANLTECFTLSEHNCSIFEVAGVRCLEHGKNYSLSIHVEESKKVCVGLECAIIFVGPG